MHLNAISMGDIHFKPNSKLLYQELQSEFVPFIESEKELIDLIVVDGDYFDKPLPLTSEGSQLAIAFFIQLHSFCTKNKIYLRVMRGTVSHDLNQLETFRCLENEYFSIINKVTSEEIKGCKILFIPEEYPEDQKEYYKELVYDKEDKYYDLSFIHGTFTFQAHTSQIIETERAIKNAPIWVEEEIVRIVKGFISCGHIHLKCNWKGIIHYHSSFTRSGFGEEGDKGFNVVSYDTEIEEDNFVEHIKNEKAPPYITIKVDKDVNLSNVDGFMIKIDNQGRELNEANGRLRLLITSAYLQSNYDVVKLLTAFVATKPYIEIKVKKVSKENLPIEFAEETINENEEPLEESPNAYLLNGFSQPDKTIKRFIEQTFNKEYSEEEIIKILSE